MTFRRLHRRAAVCALLVAPLAAAAQTPAPKPTPPPENGPHLTGDKVRLRLHLVKGYPFIAGAINGHPGKLLFDIGDARTLTVDNHTVSVPGGIVTGHGFFGSGQTFQTMRYPRIDTLTLDGTLSFHDMTNIPGHPGLPLEQHITPDFIGWIGLDVSRGYVAKLDYTHPSVTFFRDTPAGAGGKAALAGETVEQVIALGNPAHHNLVTYPVRIGTMALVGGFDTGSHTAAWLNDTQIAALEKAGTLRKGKGDSYTVSGITIDGHKVPPMPIEISHDVPPFAKLMPQPEGPFLVLGYEYLRLHKTVWDYDRMTVTIFKP